MNDEAKNYIREILRLKLEKFIFLDMTVDDIPEVSGNIVIYGAGMIGKLLYRCFDTKPIAFWDESLDKKELLSVSVYTISEGVKQLSEESVTVIVTPVWDYEMINNQIKAIKPSIKVVSLMNLLERL